jgi:hypothetical protein
MILFSKTVGAAVAMMLAGLADKPIDIKVVDSIIGCDSLRTSPGVELARTSADWIRIWDQHRGIDPNSTIPVIQGDPPRVDFKNMIVLAVFSGESPDMVEFKVTGSKDLGSKAVVRIEAEHMSRNSVRLQTRSFGMFMLTKYRKPLEVQLLQDGKWTTIATFAKEPTPKGD